MTTPPTAPLVLTASALENPPVDVLVDAAVRAGFDGLSLWPGAGYGTDPEHRRVIDDAGLFVWDVDAAILWVGPDDPGSPYFEEAPVDTVFACAESLGARAVNVLCIGPRRAPGAPAPLDACAEAFARAAARAAELGATCTVEFAKSTTVQTLHDANEVIRLSGAPNGGILVDTWHHHWSGVRDASFANVRAIQVSDAPHERPVDFPQATRHRREVPGTGAVDFPTVLRGAPAGTPLVVEVFNRPLLERHGIVGFAQVLGDAARAVRAASTAPQ
jgi:sugar phosphate isomerase/epimerase